MDEKCKLIVKKGGKIGLLVYFLKKVFVLLFVYTHTHLPILNTKSYNIDCLKGINKPKKRLSLRGTKLGLTPLKTPY